MSRIPFLTALLFVFSAFFSASGVTWHVDGSVPASGDGSSWETAFKTIQEGIDASSDGDTVIVGVGTYVENIHFNGRNITLTSTDPLDSTVVANTIIDGNQAGSVVTFSGTEGETCVLSGFTIQNGKAWWGGGISGYGNQARIGHNIICGNSADYAGGLNWCQGRIWKNIVTENSAGRDGGGLCNCHGTIEDNIVSRNSAGRCGGGLAYCENTVISNLVTENTAYDGGGLWKCPGRIENNTVSGNSADFGAGVYDCDGTIQKNTITANASYGEYKYLGFGNYRYMRGGGLCDCDGTIEGNAITQNRAKYGGGLSTCYGTIRSNKIDANPKRSPYFNKVEPLPSRRWGRPCFGAVIRPCDLTALALQCRGCNPGFPHLVCELHDIGFPQFGRGDGQPEALHNARDRDQRSRSLEVKLNPVEQDTFSGVAFHLDRHIPSTLNRRIRVQVRVESILDMINEDTEVELARESPFVSAICPNVYRRVG